MTKPEASDFRNQLESIAEPAARVMREDRERRIVAAAWPKAAPLVLLVPAIYLLACIVLRSNGVAFSLPLWIVAPFALAAPLIYLINISMPEPVEFSQATKLTRIDDELGLQDRMNTAREFLNEGERTPFMEAAIRDAEAHAERARAFATNGSKVAPELTLVHAAWPVAAALLLTITIWIDVKEKPTRGTSIAARTSTTVVDPTETKTPPDAAKTSKNEDKPKQPIAEPRDPRDDNQKRGDSGVTSKNRKKSRGDQGKGKSSQAESSSGQSTGEGQATDQAQPTKAGKKKPKKPKEQKPPKESKRKKNKKLPQNDESSVASSGQGKGRGSSRSPTASEWSSKDQSVADDEEELEEEDDVDDEDEESEARGGLQPSLRQRKPPVNRDLNIGFGGGKPPPHANGRGGPGLPKKQRGVAQLVLGIPYPDQIAGKPNPGRTKVTQERIEPQPQNAEPLAASDRKKRSTPMGHLSKPVLLPWMQDLVRSFQMSIQPASMSTERVLPDGSPAKGRNPK